jgi:DNA-3-methyladenine glycosylase
MGGELVPREFFSRPAQEVAPDLLGLVLEHETADGLVAVALTEVEAYAGAADPASHAYRGRTARNAVMFGPPGHAYVYFTYGMHFCVNVVCLPPGTASAVLLRAGQVIQGEDLARRRRTPANRGSAMPARDLARGPARLCQALGIDRRLDGADLCDPASPLVLARGVVLARGDSVSPRGDNPPGDPRSIAPGGRPPGIPPRMGGLPAPPYPPGPRGPRAWGGSAPPHSPLAPAIHTGPRVGVREGADVSWRFWLDGEPSVSVYRPHVPRRR